MHAKKSRLFLLVYSIVTWAYYGLYWPWIIKTVIYLEVVHKTNTSELLVVTKHVKLSGHERDWTIQERCLKPKQNFRIQELSLSQQPPASSLGLED